ncbi:MAG TPA: polysaccharide deacetylase family protein [Gemmatimonadaceae bacterium]
MSKEVIRNILWRLRLHELAAAVNRRAVIVLMYHGLVGDGDDEREGFVSSSELDWQMRYINDRFDVRPVHEWMRGARPRGKPGAAVTFDDGYRTVLTIALPILRRHRCAATVYLCPGAIESGRRLWFDDLYCTLRTLSDGGPTTASSGRGYDVLVEELKRLPSDRRAERIEQFRAEIPGGEVRWTADTELLDWDDIDRLHKGGLVSFGAHTLHHVRLSGVPADEKRLEISASHDAIAARVGACETFAYPHGLPGDFDDESAALVRSCGMIGAVTAVPGLVRRSTDPYAWPRIGVPAAVTRARFELRASGIFGEKISRRDALRRNM